MAAAGLCLLASQVAAQFPPVTVPNQDEIQVRTGCGQSPRQRSSRRKSKCVGEVHCPPRARPRGPPYPMLCVDRIFSDRHHRVFSIDSVKGAEAKARRRHRQRRARSIARNATRSQGCAVSLPRRQPVLCPDTSTQTNTFGPARLVPRGKKKIANTHGRTSVQAKCEDGTSKALVKFVGAKSIVLREVQPERAHGQDRAGQLRPAESVGPRGRTRASSIP
jgi:hypothetical protein